MNLKATRNSALKFFRTNPHLGPSLLLFLLGITFLLVMNLPAVSGALFGAGASLLGAWISDFNTRKREIASQEQKERDAIKFLTPELLRTISRVLYIQERAIINYSMNAAENNKNTDLKQPLNPEIHDLVNLGDQKEDFIPYLPLLYPNAPQAKYLDGEKAVKLITYYDSLFKLELFVKDWWRRAGQLPSNIFSEISHLSENSLLLSLECLAEFRINKSDDGFPYSDTLPVKITNALDMASKTRARCHDDFEKAKGKQHGRY
ncbi:hypothetical protein JKX24_15835 [Serratia proteamaculans]|uniref:Uncharacterized protein n=1 Tax=Serratia proteamaculans TaxID=28151 RepID=A0A7U0RLV7_SERPR|nr:MULTISPECIES: hypothetical protein [Serratia]MBO1504909.1 hypothetical protein [Serratia proteamaculans]QQX51677.1 hypothetical protein JKX24_15835 [Serratia proteamaculans]CAI1709290.1 Uncharacterised protein [Serratia quinivorans]